MIVESPEFTCNYIGGFAQVWEADPTFLSALYLGSIYDGGLCEEETGVSV